MTAITFSDGVAIGKLIYYLPCLVASVVVCSSHGFTKASGWVFLVIFTTLRIVGASAQIATISNPTETAVTVAEVASLIGLSPLLLATLGLLSRVYYSILERGWGMLFQMSVVRMVQVPATVALILSIVGITSAPSIDDFASEGTVQISVILYLVVLVILILLAAGAAIGRRMTRRGEVALIIAVAVSLPLLIVRVAYSLAATFSGNPQFNPLSGSEVVELCMVTLEEAAVVAIYLFAGISIARAVPDGEGSRETGQNMIYRAGRGDFGGGKLGVLSLAVHAAQAAMAERPGNARAG